MLDILQKKDYIEPERNSFLDQKRVELLRRVFGAKRVGGKLKIEIGIQLLTLKKIVKENGWYGEQMRLSFYKPPASFPQLKSKVPYHTIDCMHVLREKDYIPFKSNFYKSFTTGLSEKSFDVLEEGMKFLCLVEQSEKMFEKDGTTQHYLKGKRVGQEIVLVDCTIRSIFKEDYDIDKIKFKYMDLYKFLNE